MGEFMIGIDPVTLASMVVLAGYKPECPSHDPTQINITPVSEKVKYDISQSLKDIQRYDTDTVDPYSFHGQSITQAFMRGSVGMGYNIEFSTSTNPNNGVSCMWYKAINIEIKVDPTIVVAKEIYHDACMRKAVIGHELKHVKVDREVVNKYAKSIGSKLMSGLKSRGFTAGPFNAERAPEVKAKMVRVVSQIVEFEKEKMDLERRERQLRVDTLEEYERVDDQCPNFQKKKDVIYADILQ